MISFIVAMDNNRVIGKENALPWRLPADLAYFKKVTMGNPVIMGRKTFESIGRPLPGRKNIILTRNEAYHAEGCTIVHSTQDVLKLERQTESEMFVIGGAEIFSLLLDEADKLYITYINAAFEGDTFFPEVNKEEWVEVSRERGIQNEQNPYEYYFSVLERKGK